MNIARQKQARAGTALHPPRTGEDTTSGVEVGNTHIGAQANSHSAEECLCACWVRCSFFSEKKIIL